MSIILGGNFGDPAEVSIPSRSWRRICSAIFGAEDHAEVDRRIGTQAIVTPGGVNISEVTVLCETLDSRRQEMKVHIYYRNGYFWKSTIEKDGSSSTCSLAEALRQMNLPVG